MLGPKKRRRCAAAVAVLAAISATMMSMARADKLIKNPHAAKPYALHPTSVPSGSNTWPSTKSKDGCTWPYTNQSPPCMSTWPEGDPHYDGGGAGS